MLNIPELVSFPSTRPFWSLPLGEFLERGIHSCAGDGYQMFDPKEYPQFPDYAQIYIENVEDA